jgi:hypothetical protein
VGHALRKCKANRPAKNESQRVTLYAGTALGPTRDSASRTHNPPVSEIAIYHNHACSGRQKQGREGDIAPLNRA